MSVTVLDAQSKPGEANEQSPQEPLFGPDEPVVLEDLGRIRVPPRNATTLRARIVDVGRLTPRVYLSDEEE